MKKFVVATALLVGLGGNAQAATINATVVPNGGTTPFSLVNFGSGGSAGKVNATTSPVDVAGAGFTVFFEGTSGVYVGDVSGQTRSPFRDAGGAATDRHYLNRRAGTANTMTLVFDTPQTAFNLLWGSVDSGASYNLLTFNIGGTMINGDQVKNAAAGSFFGTSNLAVMISNLNSFTTIIVSANNEAFEFNPGVAVSQVPDGGATLALLGGALMGLGVLRRKFRA